MNRLVLYIAVLLGTTMLISSCQKDVSSDPNNTSPVNFSAAYVVNGGSNDISVINLATNNVEKSISLPKLQNNSMTGMMGSGTVNMWPHHISLSPDKSKLAVSLPGSDFGGGSGMMLSSFTNGSTMGNVSSNLQTQGKILILDAVSGDVLKELTLDGIAFNAVFSPDGKEIWTALMLPEGKVKVFDASTYALLNTIQVGQMPAQVSFSDDGKKVYVANGMSNNVTVMDAITKKVLETTTSGNYPVGAWPGMGGMMFVTNEKDQTINMMNGTTGMMSGTVQLGFIPGMAVQNSMMNQMWVTDPNGKKVHVWNNTGSGYVAGGIVTVGNGASAIAFSKDGTTCYITNQNDGTVSVVNVLTLKEMMKISVGQKPNDIVIRYM